MNTFMHCWYIHFTTNTLNQGFYHYIPLCLQCVHACIAATFNLNQVACIKVFVIIFHCVHNAYMHALLILSLHTKYPDSGFLSYPFVFAMHACMHCLYIQLTTKTMNQGFVIIFCCVCNEYIHALPIHSLYNKYPESGFLSLYPFVFAMRACMHCCYIQPKLNSLH